jgi:hypothetical protein
MPTTEAPCVLLVSKPAAADRYSQWLRMRCRLPASRWCPPAVPPTATRTAPPTVPHLQALTRLPTVGGWWRLMSACDRVWPCCRLHNPVHVHKVGASHLLSDLHRPPVTASLPSALLIMMLLCLQARPRTHPRRATRQPPTAPQPHTAPPQLATQALVACRGEPQARCYSSGQQPAAGAFWHALVGGQCVGTMQ